MYFQHSAEIWRDYPELVPGLVVADGVHADVSVGAGVARFARMAVERLAGRTEAELPEIQAWRRAFSRMGLKPTQYRCASEQLLRRFRREGSLPEIHPLIDICNAISLAYAIPVAALDIAQIADHIEVRYASGDEAYTTFGGEVEHPTAGEVVFADAAGQAHARRWTNRQSGASAVRATTTAVVIVAEAMHATASTDVERLVAAVRAELVDVWSVSPTCAVPTSSTPRFEF